MKNTQALGAFIGWMLTMFLAMRLGKGSFRICGITNVIDPFSPDHMTTAVMSDIEVETTIPIASSSPVLFHALSLGNKLFIVTRSPGLNGDEQLRFESSACSNSRTLCVLIMQRWYKQAVLPLPIPLHDPEVDGKLCRLVPPFNQMSSIPGRHVVPVKRSYGDELVLDGEVKPQAEEDDIVLVIKTCNVENSTTMLDMRRTATMFPACWVLNMSKKTIGWVSRVAVEPIE